MTFNAESFAFSEFLSNFAPMKVFIFVLRRIQTLEDEAPNKIPEFADSGFFMSDASC